MTEDGKDKDEELLAEESEARTVYHVETYVDDQGRELKVLEEMQLLDVTTLGDSRRQFVEGVMPGAITYKGYAQVPVTSPDGRRGRLSLTFDIDAGSVQDAFDKYEATAEAKAKEIEEELKEPRIVRPI